MSEKGILFNGAMVRAIIAGNKTHTRRPFRKPYEIHANGYITRPRGNERLCPYIQRYEVGDYLYVRETYGWNGCLCCGIHYQATEPQWKKNSMSPLSRWYPSIHMPKSASRLWLEVLVSAWEPVAEITEESARKEGIPDTYEEALAIFGKEFLLDRPANVWSDSSVIDNFAWVWDRCYGNGAFKRNEPVEVYAFKQIEVSHES